METVYKKIQKSVQSIHKSVLQILELPTTHSTEEIINYPAASQKDINALSLNLPHDHIEKTIQFFARISMFFEMGVLLQNRDNSWFPQSFFKNKNIQIFDEQKRKIKFQFHELQIHRICRTPGYPILNKLNMLNELNHHDLQCFRVQLTPDFLILILTNKPEIFLHEQIKLLQINIHRAFP